MLFLNYISPYYIPISYMDSLFGQTYQARLGALQNRAVKLIGGGNFRDSPNLIKIKYFKITRLI